MPPEYHAGHLYWSGYKLSQIAEKLGTPIHVCCREAIQDSVHTFRQSFEQVGVKIGCHFSVKTNPIPEYLRILGKLGFGVEVVSPYELWLVQQLGFKGEDIVITGLKSQTDYCLNAAHIRLRMWVLESLRQIEFLASVSNQINNPVNIGLRICPTLRHSRFNLTVSSGSQRSPFGFLPDSAELEKAYQIITNHDRFNFVGFHVHLGSGILDSRPYQKAFKIIRDVMLSAAEKGCLSKILNIGGGFGCAAAPVHSSYNLFRTFFSPGKQKHHNQVQNNLLTQVALAVRALCDHVKKEGIDIETIIVEPGRMIAATTQIMLLTVEDVIERPGKKKFLLCDGGAMSISPMLLIERHRVLPLARKAGELYDYCILGNLPSSLDMVAPSIPLPRVNPGDRLAILDTGAYFFSFNNNFAGPRAAIVMIEDGQVRLLRRRETYEDMVANDLLSLK